ncbi:MAG: DNA-binding response regulator [Candidatus Marinimicrobia bacterium CG08_land_8_20_14_0_20_45_22]|nr:MAG: DNA-binding response regulator [Candidatus Marinimicrobia bacterium CG08_land_8_20_14_0_20_45_22]
MASVLIIDDDRGIGTILQEVLSAEGHDVTALISAEDGMSFLKVDEPDLILLDLQLPGMSGIEFLEKFQDKRDQIPVIIITSSGDVQTAVRAMKLGASDYIKKPFNIEEIVLIIQKVLDSKTKDEHLAYLRGKNEISESEKIVGESSEIKSVFQFIQHVATTIKTTVLIRGETGTGKELVAKAIHYISNRAKKPFIEINCSAFQETLLEAELFGYEPGAFTDARQRKRGLLEIADHGTFFLDEIGDMSMGLQSKILKVIEKQCFRRVGGTKEISVDTRIISATSRDLEKNIVNHTFREDLFYRLNVASIYIPPLRQREGDVLLLAEHFLRIFNTEFKKNIQGFTNEAKSRLVAHSWPGNVRELKNVIERAVLFETEKVITLKHLNVPKKEIIRPEMEILKSDWVELPQVGVSLSNIEKELIQKAIIQTNGNQTRAAKLLNITRETLKYRMRKHRISRQVKPISI